MLECPYCLCRDICGREPAVRAPDHNRAGLVFEAVRDLHSKDAGFLDLDPLHLVGELIERGYFGLFDQPSLVHTGHAQDLLRGTET